VFTKPPNPNINSLMNQSRKGCIKCIDLILDNDVSINSFDNIGMTALMWATYSQNLDVVNYLITSGANLNQKRKYFGQTALMLSSFFGNYEIVKSLISNGATIDINDNNGKNAIIWAIEKNHNEIAEFLTLQSSFIK
jgi:ankyrin repeat protein|tara:strand:+ start:6278 stop:6688 length:411 start_codon:yes stop_codon:yes gene_type:complete